MKWVSGLQWIIHLNWNNWDPSKSTSSFAFYRPPTLLRPILTTCQSIQFAYILCPSYPFLFWIYKNLSFRTLNALGISNIYSMKFGYFLYNSPVFFIFLLRFTSLLVDFERKLRQAFRESFGLLHSIEWFIYFDGLRLTKTGIESRIEFKWFACCCPLFYFISFLFQMFS